MAKNYSGPGPMSRPTSDPKQHPSKGGASKSSTQKNWNVDVVTPNRPTSAPKPNIPGRAR